jgi:N-glycosylase/DNA lyase
LPNPSTTPQEHAFEISTTKINGPLNLTETVLSAQTSEPEWTREIDGFTDVEELGDTPVKYTLRQSGDVDNCEIRVTAVSSTANNNNPTTKLEEHLNKVLGLKDDLLSFYRTFEDDAPLFTTFSLLRGLRLMRGTNLFESLICSILSQNNSALLWNRTARLMMKLYGRRVNLPDGSASYLFPTPPALAILSARELQSKTSMGYRAKPVVQVSRMVNEGELNLDEIVTRGYDEAMETLLELPGVGPKVADCFILYGAGKLEAAPVDVWIHRIVTRCYFRGRKVSRLKTARFLRERFGIWAGYAQLYLFDYVRRTAPARGKFRKRSL